MAGKVRGGRAVPPSRTTTGINPKSTFQSPTEKSSVAEDNEILKSETVTEILYHGRGGRTHVTATFPLDQLESVVERVKAQRQCWAQAAERLANNSTDDTRVVRMGEEITQGETQQTRCEDTRPGSRVGSRVGKRLRPSPINEPIATEQEQENVSN